MEDTKVMLAKAARKLKEDLINKQSFMLDPILEVTNEEGLTVGTRAEIESWDKGFLAGLAVATHDAVREILKIAEQLKGDKNG